jgi:hypothetical protein
MTGAPLIDRLARGGLSNSSLKRFTGGASNDKNSKNPPRKLPLAIHLGD